MSADPKNSISPRADKSLRRRIENIKRQKIVGKKIVNLSEFRELKADSDQRTVLVVDDDEVMRNGLKRILENEGYRVEVAMDGLDLSKKLDAVRFDLIILDVNLPWVDGFELCGLIKGHPVLKAIPIVMVSARKGREDIEAGFKAGADDYVTKPFDVDFISKVVSKALNQAG